MAEIIDLNDPKNAEFAKQWRSYAQRCASTVDKALRNEKNYVTTGLTHTEICGKNKDSEVKDSK